MRSRFNLSDIPADYPSIRSGNDLCDCDLLGSQCDYCSSIEEMNNNPFKTCD